MLHLFCAMLVPLNMEMMRALLCRADGGMSWKWGSHMDLGLCTVAAQIVLASVIVPHVKALQGEERFFLGGIEIFGTSLSEGAFSSPETAFLFLYDSHALSRGLVQTNEKEACSLISLVFGHGHG